MTERLLQFLWQFQYFNRNDLTTSAGDSVQVIHPGQYNKNQGPDFSNAKIMIGETTWAGNVEIHFKTSDWKRHGHHKDQHYNNVILHVVWEDDSNGDHQLIPLIQLKERVPKILLHRYNDLMNAASFIPCERSIQTFPSINRKSWEERLLAERLMRKAKAVEVLLLQSNDHWEEVCWWLLARNFGIKVNADAFEAMARSIPINLIAKHKSNLFQLEALMMGQAGLLDQRFIQRDLFGKEEYPYLIQREYRFFQKKYNLHIVPIQPQFLRMRPRNFPTIRLAQLAVLVHQSEHLFSIITESASIEEIRKQFDMAAGGFWDNHYRFNETSPVKTKKLGSGMVNNIIINTIVPVLFAYGNYQGNDDYKQKALQWLEETEAENNSIIHHFEKIDIESANAFESQALLELKTQYCEKKRCLECAVGNWLLKG